MSLRYIVNILMFQIGWFACIWLGDVGALAVTALVLCLHFVFIVQPTDRRLEGLFLLKVLAVGIIVETVYLFSGVLARVDGLLLPPVWLLLLWVLFATTLNYSLHWLKSRTWLAIILVAISAPGSYFAGAAISDSMDLASSTVISLLAVAVSWAIIFPLLMHWTRPKLQIA